MKLSILLATSLLAFNNADIPKTAMYYKEPYDFISEEFTKAPFVQIQIPLCFEEERTQILDIIFYNYDEILKNPIKKWAQNNQCVETIDPLITICPMQYKIYREMYIHILLDKLESFADICLNDVMSQEQCPYLTRGKWYEIELNKMKNIILESNGKMYSSDKEYIRADNFYTIYPRNIRMKFIVTQIE